MNRPLIKHTIVIWTETDEATRDLEDLAYEAVEGGAYCSRHSQVEVADPLDDDDAPSAEFFRLEEEDE